MSEINNNIQEIDALATAAQRLRETFSNASDDAFCYQKVLGELAAKGVNVGRVQGEIVKTLYNQKAIAAEVATNYIKITRAVTENEKAVEREKRMLDAVHQGAQGRLLGGRGGWDGDLRHVWTESPEVSATHTVGNHSVEPFDG